MFNKPFLSCCVLLILLALAVGCGKKKPRMESNRCPVTGTVTFDGKPIAAGIISFVSAKDPIYSATASLGEGGHFEVADAPAGKVLVAVQTKTALFGSNASAYVPIPEKYNNPNTSGLTADIDQSIKDGPVLKFELKSK
jgi:hypothetical protein